VEMSREGAKPRREGSLDLRGFAPSREPLA
jgi:hypothetical protein